MEWHQGRASGAEDCDGAYSGLAPRIAMQGGPRLPAAIPTGRGSAPQRGTAPWEHPLLLPESIPAHPAPQACATKWPRGDPGSLASPGLLGPPERLAKLCADLKLWLGSRRTGKGPMMRSQGSFLFSGVGASDDECRA
jgi:hypothetical protein